MKELHQGICGYHSGARTMSTRILRAGYYWSTMMADVNSFVKRCIPCQKHENISHVKQEELHNISSQWPFAKWGMDIIGPFTPGKGQAKFLLVVVDYFTKWIEADPLATITAQQVQKFVWRNIICCFGILHTIITDNGKQFTDAGLKDFYLGLHIKHVTSSVEHPQGNGQAEAANKVILQELKKRLDQAKGLWPEQLLEVLWAYRCTPQSTTKETPYSLTYGTDAMIPVEIGEPSLRQQNYEEATNAHCLASNLDLLPEHREHAKIQEAAAKVRMPRRYNSKVKPRKFHPGDLVWQMNSNARKVEGKFSANWEDPFRVTADEGKGAYRLQHLCGTPVPRTWNVTHLKFYYS